VPGGTTVRSICRRAIALVLIPLVVTACSTWQAEPTPAEYLQSHTAERARVTRRDSSRLELRNVQLRGDSVWGEAGGGMAGIRSVRIAVSDVQRMEVLRYSRVRTFAPFSPFVVAALVYLTQCNILSGC